MARRKPVTFDVVLETGRALPDVEVSTSWGAPALKVRGRMFACRAINKSAEPDSLVVLIDFEQRDAMIAADPDTYYLTDHYVGYPCVLARVARLHPDALHDLLLTGWRYVTSRRRRPGRRAGRGRRLRS